MLAERPSVEKAVEEAITFCGYTSSGGSGDHAGRTFHLKYVGDWGSDQIKIDLIYLNRVPLIAPQLRPCRLRPTLSVLTFSDLELIGGKAKALYDRITVRDIYDIANLKPYLDRFLVENSELKELCHKIILFYVSISNYFPLPLNQRVRNRFFGRDNELTSQLYPMLRNGGQPTLESLIVSAESFITDYVLPRNEREREYLELLANADYQPTLLFEDCPDTLAAAEANPEALWKLANLEKMRKQ